MILANSGGFVVANCESILKFDSVIESCKSLGSLLTFNRWSGSDIKIWSGLDVVAGTCVTVIGVNDGGEMVSTDETLFVVSTGMLSEKWLKIFFVSLDLNISGVVVVSKEVLSSIGRFDNVFKVVLVGLGLSLIRMNVGLWVGKSFPRCFVFMLWKNLFRFLNCILVRVVEVEVGAEEGNAVDASTEKEGVLTTFTFSWSSFGGSLCSSFSRATNDAETIQA